MVFKVMVFPGSSDGEESACNAIVLEMNRDHSVIFEIASKYCILLTMMATPFLLRDSCLQ